MQTLNTHYINWERSLLSNDSSSPKGKWFPFWTKAHTVSILLLFLTILVLVALVGCMVDDEPKAPTIAKKNINLIVVGDANAAGVQDFSITEESQEASYPTLIANQLEALKSVRYESPVMDNGERKNPDKIPTNISQPGGLIADYVEEKTYEGTAQTDSTPLENPLLYPIYTSANQGTTLSIIDAAVYASKYYNPSPDADHKTVILINVGIGDIIVNLFNASGFDQDSGMSGLSNMESHFTESEIPSLMTATHIFAEHYETILDELSTQLDATIFTATLPDVTQIGALWNKEDILRYFPDDAEALEALADTDYMSMLTRMIAQFFGQPIENFLTDANILSEEEQALIQTRIDEYNTQITSLSQTYGATVVDLASYNDFGADGTPVTISGVALTPQWGIGGAFSADGVNYSNSYHAVIANRYLESMGLILGLSPDEVDLKTIHADDPYVDRDGDGYMPGRAINSDNAMITMLSSYIFDSNDSDAEVHPDLSSFSFLGSGGGGF